ncbi:MAG: sugar phosphate isomerase/epimerase [Syntrophorhabdaceae bacterium]|nr:sugar phosphate isomerase/epimerase [Syntrophorhabdaceae bacterium]
MKFSIRRDVGFSSFEKDLSALKGIPIELALPYKLEDFLLDMDHLDDLAAYVQNTGIIISSVHAPQGRLSDESFFSWALPTVQFAQKVGASVAVFHPESVPKLSKPSVQSIALRNVKRLQRETPTTVAVETFGNAKRIITPKETISLDLPMVLDTSHLFVRRIFEIIENYSKGIVGVHLSEMRYDDAAGHDLPHLPVASYGLEVLETLRIKGWNGNVTLEYLPQFHDRLIPDRAVLEELFASQLDNLPSPVPPPFREDILATKKAERKRQRSLPLEGKVRRYFEPLLARHDKDSWVMPEKALFAGVRRHRSEKEGYKWCYIFPGGRKVYFNTKEEGDAYLETEMG